MLTVRWSRFLRKILVALPLTLTTALSTSALASSEVMAIADRIDGRFAPADKANGRIAVGARPYPREIRIGCDALASRQGGGAAWSKLVINSDIDGISFEQRVDIDLVASIASPQMIGLIPPGVTRDVNISHTSGAAVANLLSCRVIVK